MKIYPLFNNGNFNDKISLYRKNCKDKQFKRKIKKKIKKVS